MKVSLKLTKHKVGIQQTIKMLSYPLKDTEMHSDLNQKKSKRRDAMCQLTATNKY